MFSTIKNIFNNKNKELELKEKELILKERELELKEKEINNNFTEVKTETINKEKENIEKTVITKKKRIYSDEEKKAYALRMKELKEKGKAYEEFIAGYYKLEGYSIYLNGIKKGKKDKGIDIICTKDEELILIQCKNWSENSKYKIGHKDLKAFVGCCTDYVNENKLFDKKIKLKFIASNNIIDISGKKYLEETKTLQYEILKYEN